jgi:TatA/E family protein of Tat protein translocase
VISPAPLAILDLFSGPEAMLILFVVLIFFGGKRMPEFARGFGKAMRELRKAAGEVEREFKRVMDDAERTSGIAEIISVPKLIEPHVPPASVSPKLPELPPAEPPSPPQSRPPGRTEGLGGGEFDPTIDV